MNAITVEKYGDADVLKFTEIEEPELKEGHRISQTGHSRGKIVLKI